MHTYSVTQRLAFPVFVLLAAKIDPICKRSFFVVSKPEKPEAIQTTHGELEVFRYISGLGRIAHAGPGGAFTFAHAEFASVLSWDTCNHQVERNGEITVTAPNQNLLQNFLAQSFSIRLLPTMSSQGNYTAPRLRRGQLINYRLAAFDEACSIGSLVAADTARGRLQ